MDIITQKEIQFFEESGYLVVENLIDAETIASGVQKLESQTLLMKLPALIVLSRARSRMAKPDAALLLQQALSNALAIDEFQYIIPVRFAIIEHAWLIDDFHQAETHISELRILELN